MSTVVLVEDDPDNRTVVEDIFAFDEVGAELVTTESAEEALAWIPDVGPILVLMDIGLPGISGLEAAERLKADPRTSGIPIWALTAHAMKDMQRAAADAGCEGFVTKPIDSAELADRLRRFVRGERGRAA